jgi:hypothetical protein
MPMILYDNSFHGYLVFPTIVTLTNKAAQILLNIFTTDSHNYTG